MSGLDCLKFHHDLQNVPEALALGSLGCQRRGIRTAMQVSWQHVG